MRVSMVFEAPCIVPCVPLGTKSAYTASGITAIAVTKPIDQVWLKMPVGDGEGEGEGGEPLRSVQVKPPSAVLYRSALSAQHVLVDVQSRTAPASMTLAATALQVRPPS